MRADLDALSAEVASFGVRASTSGIEARTWIDLHSRIGRVTQGESPTEGPRYQSTFPPEVVAAVAALDGAVADGNPTRANEALQDLNGAFWSWVEKAPPQLVQNAYDVAEQIDVLAYSASAMTADEIAQHWAPSRSRLRL